MHYFFYALWIKKSWLHESKVTTFAWYLLYPSQRVLLFKMWCSVFDVSVNSVSLLENSYSGMYSGYAMNDLEEECREGANVNGMAVTVGCNSICERLR